MVGNWRLRAGVGCGGGEFAVYTGYEYSGKDVAIDKQIDRITVKASLLRMKIRSYQRWNRRNMCDR